jgi:hypothetical protein
MKRTVVKPLAHRIGSILGSALASAVALTGTAAGDNLEAAVILLVGVAVDLVFDRKEKS